MLKIPRHIKKTAPPRMRKARFPKTDWIWGQAASVACFACPAVCFSRHSHTESRANPVIRPARPAETQRVPVMVSGKHGSLISAYNQESRMAAAALVNA